MRSRVCLVPLGSRRTTTCTKRTDSALSLHILLTTFSESEIRLRIQSLGSWNGGRSGVSDRIVHDQAFYSDTWRHFQQWEDEPVEVNQRALIDKVLARYPGKFTCRNA